MYTFKHYNKTTLAGLRVAFRERTSPDSRVCSVSNTAHLSQFDNFYIYLHFTALAFAVTLFEMVTPLEEYYA